MNDAPRKRKQLLSPADVPHGNEEAARTPLPLDPALTEHPVFQEITTSLFTSLPRNDQRQRGMEYLRGLLSTPGRKSVRNMAALLGGTGTGQSLHHFICSSPWDWTPMRRALAEHVMQAAPPQAWVVRPLLMPKTGRHSVGIGRYFCTVDGRLRNAQLATGVWLASPQACVPVQWRLHLPRPAEDGQEAPQTGAPAEQHSSVAERAAEACREMLAEWALPARPVVLALDGFNAGPAFDRLRAAGLRVAARVPHTLPLTVSDSSLTGHGGTVLPARDIMRAARRHRRPAPTPGGRASELVATVDVTLASPAGAREDAAEHERLTLVGTGSPSGQWPAELWLVTASATAAGNAVPQYRQLVRQVDATASGAGDRVGVRDYAGRSFGGWHRHVTLASAAHAIHAMATTPGTAGPRTAAQPGPRTAPAAERTPQRPAPQRLPRLGAATALASPVR